MIAYLVAGLVGGGGAREFGLYAAGGVAKNDSQTTRRHGQGEQDYQEEEDCVVDHGRFGMR